VDANAFQIIGFLLAAYSVVANDSLQTLGTYLSSNKGRTPKALQMLFICGVAAAVLLIGWFLHPAGGGLGDPAWGRLEKFPQPDNFTWVYLLPPIAVLALTQWGAPVSTSFLVLSAFEPKNATKLVLNSLSGYVMAFVLALVVYGLLMWILEKKVLRTNQEGTEVKNYWFALQWLSTGWLWSQWLVQDMANIYVYLPRQLSFGEMALSALMLCIGLCVLVWIGGGPIQGVLRSKINTNDLRSATVIDFLFGCVLFWKANITQFPLSTTWVFLGLLAGREIAVRIRLKLSDRQPLYKVLGSDLFKAGVGIVVSLIVALAIQPLKALG
jgi:phosphate/sulfate permease